MIQDDIQNEAIETWKASGYNGTLELGVGAGKTFCMFKAAYKLLEDDKISKGDKIVIKAERSKRFEHTIIPEAAKFLKFTGKDFLKDFTVEFYTYQSNTVVENAVLEVMDEVTDVVTGLKYVQISETSTPYILGLTGTPNRHTYLFPEEAVPKLYMTQFEKDNKEVNYQTTKGDIFDMFLPIVYSKTEGELIELGVLSPFETHIIYHELDDTAKRLPMWKSKPDWLVTEKQYYENKKEFALSKLGVVGINILKYDLPRFLYKLESKVNVVKELLDSIEGKTLLFGVEKDLLYKITPNVVEPKNSSSLIQQFDAGDIDVLATSKAVQQGTTLQGIQNIIFVTFQAASGQAIQSIGRVLRFVPGKIGKVYFIVTTGTMEEKWLVELQKVKDSKGKLTRTLNLNIVND